MASVVKDDVNLRHKNVVILDAASYLAIKLSQHICASVHRITAVKLIYQDTVSVKYNAKIYKNASSFSHTCKC